MAAASTALGAALVEKHLTLDKSKIGMDNQMAIEPTEMAQMVKNCQNVQIAMGSKQRTVLNAELLQRKKMRRSVIVTRDLAAGTVLSLDDLDAKRPGTGLEPGKIQGLVGRTLKKDVESDTVLAQSDIYS